MNSKSFPRSGFKNIEEEREYHRLYYVANKDKIIAKIAKWRLENRDKFNANQRRYRKENPQILAKQNKKWAMEHPVAKRELNLRYRARKLGNGLVDKITFEEVWVQNKGECGGCGKFWYLEQHGKFGWHLDHVIPLSKGGTHTWDNVQVMCWKCNLQKGVK